ncbi:MULTISPECIES: toll/interleukin-1 receptor domain-containing protein [unclassified Rhizobium]|uniref:toll/interleukin-1 receptor domain-containing protein n=1 Tax=unclassified Rhizobium TaxID=2613769 RepID=UPI001A99691C|nr:MULTISPECIES: toll/interleukin-1 receptor domain-containing protein [unclassified Rhizobium]MBX5190844.1 toll/interleukin-1 receptor domain-containing protein [Rhizobium sp. NZLR3b]MBX5204459.1 toll/interleukin-1 receptor domain-containing protein [Rhizobium sp. NZLR1]QSZ24679.1 toll/interleukin-1 receptor domain-containing protein [Rhizobium sp. NZLR1]
MTEKPYIFISHSSKDMAALTPIIRNWKSLGLNIWWSPDISEGRWDIITRQKLDEATRVVAVLTEHTANSELDYIFVELELARKQNKLIPLMIGQRADAFNLRAVTAMIQSYYFEDIAQIADGAVSAKLVDTCRRALRASAEPTPAAPTRPVAETAADRIETWFSSIEQKLTPYGQIKAFSHALAVAVFEMSPATVVDDIADDLSRRLVEAELDRASSTVDPGYPKRARQVLDLLACELATLAHPILGVDQDVVRFRDPEWAGHFLKFAWTEFPQRRKVLADWWRSIAERANADGKMRLGFALGLLAQSHYLDMFDTLLKEWLLSGSEDCQNVADVALSVAAFDPVAADAIARLVEFWAERGTRNQLSAAVRVACGYAGTRISGLSVATLRYATLHSDHAVTGELFQSIEKSLSNLMQTHAESADKTLFDLPGLIKKLADWVGEGTASQRSDNRMDENPYPLMLFLTVLGKLPLTASNRHQGKLSLQALSCDAETVRLMAIILNTALHRHRIGQHPTREKARAILKSWIASREAELRVDTLADSREDPLAILAKNLVDTAQTQDDMDRIGFLFERAFTLSDLNDKFHQQGK